MVEEEEGKMTPTSDQVRRIADAYGKEIFFSEDFHIGGLGLDEVTIDRIYSAIL